jgi:hypothetical protein
MERVIAFCSNIAQCQRDLILDPAWCELFPGTGWLPHFSQLLTTHDWRLTTGDLALDSVEAGELSASNVFVIAVEDSDHAERLISLGATGGVLICAESPLFARTFYERVAELGPKYLVRILFGGSIEAHFPNTPRTFQTRFPTFSRNGAPIVTQPWSRRKSMVMVAACKYWRTPFDPSFLLKPKKLEAWLRGKLGLSRSSIKKLAQHSQLHDRRLELIEYFGRNGQLNVFGAAWNLPYSIPWKWRLRLSSLLQQLRIETCDDKKKIIANYRFAFALENISYPGYHTEKIIDCFAAGVIPIYLGDPLIKQTMPSNSFIHLSDFNDLSDLSDYLSAFSEANAVSMLAEGRAFLKNDGDAYSYEGFAEHIITVIHPYLHN